MGPEGYLSFSSTSSRSRFSSGIKSVFWSDRNRDRLLYVKAVCRCCQFHDNLPDGNHNKIDKKNRRIFSLSDLYGCAKAVSGGIKGDGLASSHGANLIVSQIYKRDLLSVVSLVCDILQLLLGTRRGHTESYRSYGSWFDAQLSKLRSLGSSATFLDALKALSLLANAGVDSAEQICILSAAAPLQQGLSSRSSLDDFVILAKYKAIAAVIRQCDQPLNRSSKSHLWCDSKNRLVTAFTAHAPQSKRPP